MKPINYLLAGALCWPFIFLAFNTFPVADDFIFPVTARGGFWQTQWDHYIGLTGRYTGLIIQSLHPFYFSNENIWGYHITPLITIVLYIFGLFLFLKRVLKIEESAFLFAILITFFYFSNNASLHQSLYWWASSTIFDYGNIAWIACLVISFHYVQRIEDPNLRWGSLAMTFICFGFSEVGAITLLISNTIILIVFFLRSCNINADTLRTKLKATLFVSINLLGFCANMLAPGNIYKASYSNSSNLTDAFLGIINFDLLAFIQVNYFLLLILLLASFFWGLSSSRSSVENREPSLIIVFSAASLFFTTFASLWFFNFALSVDGDLSTLPARTINALIFPSYVLFITISFYCGVKVTSRWGGSAQRYQPYCLHFATFAFLLLIVTGSNYRLAANEIFSGKVYAYSTAMQERFEELLAKSGSMEPVVFDSPAEYPASISSRMNASLMSLTTSVNGPLLSGVFNVPFVSENPVHSVIVKHLNDYPAGGLSWVSSNPFILESVNELAWKLGDKRVKAVRVSAAADEIAESSRIFFIEWLDERAIGQTLKMMSPESQIVMVTGVQDGSGPVISENFGYEEFASRFSGFKADNSQTVSSKERIHFSSSFHSQASCDDEIISLFASADRARFTVLDVYFNRLSTDSFELSIIYVLEDDLPMDFTYIAHLATDDLLSLAAERRNFGFADFSRSGDSRSYCTFEDVKIRKASLLFNSNVKRGYLSFGIFTPDSGVLATSVIEGFFEN